MSNTGKDGDQHDNISDDDAIAAYCLTLPGETLYLTPLLAAKKFRNRGNKDGAVRAFLQLEEEGMGKTWVVGGSKGTTQVRSETLFTVFLCQPLQVRHALCMHVCM